MIDLLHSFAVGIAFSVGVCTGALLCTIATRAGRKEAQQSFKDSQDKIERRLAGSLKCHTRMADAMERWAENAGKIK